MVNVYVFQASTAATLLGAVKRDGPRRLGCKSAHYVRTFDEGEKFYQGTRFAILATPVEWQSIPDTILGTRYTLSVLFTSVLHFSRPLMFCN